MKKVVVIGGGIIGLNSAYYLNKMGYSVTLIDRNPESAETSASYGNAGMLAPSHFIPLSSPGIIAKGLKWMLNPASPFYIRPRLSRDLISWGIKFMRSSTKQNVERSKGFLKEINQASMELYRDLADELPFDFDYKNTGLLMLCKTQEALKKEEITAKVAAELGLKARLLNKKEVNQIEPCVHQDVIGAVLYPGDGFLSPRKLMNGLKKQMSLIGVTTHYNTHVTGFKTSSHRIDEVLSDKGNFSFDEVVISGGVWTAELLKELKIRLPMQGGKGYNVTIENPETKINYPAILVEASSAVSPFESRLRLAGTMEIDGYNLGITQKRVDNIIRNTSNYYQFKDESAFMDATPWAGLRPVSPDGLPFIGRVSGFENLTIGTGHGMMGLNMGPITGKLISEIIAGKQSSFDLALMNPERFS